MEGIDSGECGQRLRSAGENAHLVPKNNNEVINEVTRIINEVKNIKFYFGNIIWKVFQDLAKSNFLN